MTKHTLKIFRCEHHKIFEVGLAIFQRYEKKGLSCFRTIIFQSKYRKTYIKLSMKVYMGYISRNYRLSKKIVLKFALYCFIFTANKATCLMPGLKVTFNASFEGSLLKPLQYCIICKKILLRG